MTSKWFIREICAIVHKSGFDNGRYKILGIDNYSILLTKNQIWDKIALNIIDKSKSPGWQILDLNKLTKTEWKQIYNSLIIRKLKNNQ